MSQRDAVSREEAQVLQLLRARYGYAPSQTPLRLLLQHNPQFDRFDWSLFILCIEIDLHVTLTPTLLEPNRWTVAQFARKVASLPKTKAPTHTLELLTLLSDELLSARASPATAGSPQRARRTPRPPSHNKGKRVTSKQRV